MHLQALLQSRFDTLAAKLSLDPKLIADTVKPTKEAKFGDYQCNAALALSKSLGKKPREVAELMIAHLDQTSLEKPEIAGPGFINLKFSQAWLTVQIQSLMKEDRLGVPAVEKPLTYVIDYSSPNVAKPMHVGHLRSTIIGDSLTRLLRFLGHTVITDNHLGDWGTQFGMLIYGWKHFLDQKSLELNPVQEMVRIYVKVRNLTKPADEEDVEDTDSEKKYTPEELTKAKEILNECRLETAKLHQGDADNYALWQRMMPWCLAELDRVYLKLGILPFDQTLGESAYNPMLKGVVESLERKNITEISRGAKVVFHGEGQPPSIVQKGDGAYTYTTTDLATIQKRADEFKADVALYVVDARQSLHFEHLFSIARNWGYEKLKLIHIAFGSVLGADRRPIKTREGGAIELGQLLDEAIQQARKVVDANSGELPETQREEIARVVGIGAVKYADLCQNRTMDYTFSFDKMLAMDGNTAAYMQYAYARNRSIFRKGNIDPVALRKHPPAISLEQPEERRLAMALLRFPESLEAAAKDYKPNVITAYLWELADAYSSFFHSCRVLQAETDALKESRLCLCDLTARVIQKGLDLLGIDICEQM